MRAVGYGRARWSYIGGEVREEDEGAGAAAVAQCPLLRLDWAEDEDEEAGGALPLVGLGFSINTFI